jgi:hypothetical protein
MPKGEYLQNAEAAGSQFGTKLGDQLAVSISGIDFESETSAGVAHEAVKAYAVAAIAGQTTHPYTDKDAAKAWRDAALSICISHIMAAYRLTIKGTQ